MATNTSIPPLRNTVHHVVVTTSSTGITVTMDGTQVLSYATALPQYVLVGFTGGTGGGNDIHQVQNVSIMATSSGVPSAHRHRRQPERLRRSAAAHRSRSPAPGSLAPAQWTLAPTRPTFTVTNSTTIVATSPPGTGTVDVTVTTPVGGTSPTSSADQYTYVNDPHRDRRKPDVGPGYGWQHGHHHRDRLRRRHRRSTSAGRTRRRHSPSSTRPPSLPPRQAALLARST